MYTFRRFLGALAVLLTSAVAIGQAGPAAAAYPEELRSNAIVPIQPARLMDTRSGNGISTVDGTHVGTGRGTTWKLQVAGRGGIPANARAAVLNVTAIQPEGAGFVTVYPCGTDRPTASSINYRPGQIVPNAVVTKLDADGAACVFSSSATHIAVDANGFVPRLGRFGPLDPARVLDTRSDGSTADGELEGIGRMPANSTQEVQVTGRVGVPDGAGTVLINATAIGGSGPGYLTIFPCGSARPNASSINYLGGDVIPNLVAAKVGSNGRICVYTLRDVDVAIDVAGFVPAGGDLTTIDPARIVDTRAGHRTIDGEYQAFGRLAPNDPLKIDVAGRAGVPSDASAVLLNVGAVYPGGPGFVKVYPCDERPPGTSNVNYFGGDVQSNAVLSKVAADGTVCLITSKPSHVIVDVNGFVPPAAYRTSEPYVEAISSCEAEVTDARLVDGSSHTNVLVTGAAFGPADCPGEIAFAAFDLSRRVCRITTTVAPTDDTEDGQVGHARLVTPGGQVLQQTALTRDQKAGLNVSVRGLNRVRLESHDENGSEIAWVNLTFHYCTTADGTPTTVQQPFVETRTSKPRTGTSCEVDQNDFNLNGTERPWAFGFEVYYSDGTQCANGAPYLDIRLDRKYCRITGATAFLANLEAGSSAVSRVLTQAGQPLGSWITNLGEDRAFDVNIEGRDTIRLMSYVEGEEFLGWHSIVLHRCLDADGNPTTSPAKADRSTVFLPLGDSCRHAANETYYMANFERPAAQIILDEGKTGCSKTGVFTGGYVELILEGKYCKVRTKVGPADVSAEGQPIIFKILTRDGNQLATTGPITKPHDLEADISGLNRVRLFANTDPGEEGVFAGTRLIRC